MKALTSFDLIRDVCLETLAKVMKISINVVDFRSVFEVGTSRERQRLRRVVVARVSSSCSMLRVVGHSAVETSVACVSLLFFFIIKINFHNNRLFKLLKKII